MVTYLSCFCENLAEITHASSKNRDTPQADAFQKVNDLITKAQVLTYYDKEKPLTLQYDASKSGLGCTLMQDGMLIAYASKIPNQSEMNYAQIEKELFGCRHSINMYTAIRLSLKRSFVSLISEKENCTQRLETY